METSNYGRPWQQEYVWKITIHNERTVYKSSQEAVNRLVNALKARNARITVQRYTLDRTEH